MGRVTEIKMALKDRFPITRGARVALSIFVVSMGIVLCIYGVIIRQQNAKIESEIEKNRTAVVFLCAQQDNLQQRVRSTKAFLDAGGRIPGVSKDLIEDGLRRDELTLKTMRLLDCKE